MNNNWCYPISQFDLPYGLYFHAKFGNERAKAKNIW